MTREDQKQFVRDLSRLVIEDIIKKIEAGTIPEEWDGIELRLLLADKFNNEVHAPRYWQKRIKDYKNTIATTTI